jgi:catechol 2,3-dioxygenase-like lactoylglutathione lyase family enzyme
MITGVHALIYTSQADAVRGFFRDVLGRRHVDAGDGWPIFSMPPAELAVHPSDTATTHELYLMCDDIGATVGELETKGVRCSPVQDQGWGLVTSVELPGGDRLGLYEPRHPTAIDAT